MDNTNVKNPDLFVNIVKKAQSKNELDGLVSTYSSTMDNSIEKKKIRYGAKKKKKTSLVQKATLYISIMAILVGTGALAKVSTDYISQAVEEKAIYDVYSDAIDSKIDDYYKMMNHTGKEGERIENVHGYNEEAKDAYVSYNPGVLRDYIINNMDVSETELRCVVLSAYKVINEPYRSQVFDKVFSSISSDEEYKDKLPDYLNVKSFDEYIKSLGYEDVKEYNNHERENIKQLSIEEQMNNGFKR